jgi:hypothetical protein
MLRTIRHKMVTTWLDVARLPADVATRVLPNGTAGPRARAQVFVDHVDAATRTILGGLLRDEELEADGRRRRIAADERADALRLHTVADEKLAEADRRVEQARTQAAKDRDRSRKEAAKAIEQVAEKAEDRKDRVEQQADAAERQVEQAREAELERVEKQAKRARLAAVEDEAKALDAEAAALTAEDEAERLADAAASAKEQRKKTG